MMGVLAARVAASCPVLGASAIIKECSNAAAALAC